MAYAAVTALFRTDCSVPAGILLTAVLQGGCNLHCPFCIVAKRDERRETSYVSADHLTALQSAIEKRGLLGGAAIVGDEPLQAHCWPTAKGFLKRDRDCKLPTALISNGYNLVDYVDELRALEDTKILISLDAASEKHDAIRRKPGAFARIAEGIRFAAQYPELRERISIAAILMPGNLDSISEIVSFAAANRIPKLLLSPLLTSARDEALTVHPKVMREAWRAIPKLLEQANAEGVKLCLSDEFAVLGPWEEWLANHAGIDFATPSEPAHLIRVDAAGRVETMEAMRTGITTGLRLPAEISEIDRFAEHVISSCSKIMNIAA